MGKISYDVAVVGAGPAGATAAVRLAAAGLRVALLEKEPLPRYKTCGGGLVGRALSRFPVDVAPVVQHRCHRAEIHLWDPDLAVHSDRVAPVVAMTMRDELDAHLTRAAAARGADVHAPCRVDAVRAQDQRITLTTSTGDVTARFVIAATGATGGLARAAGWPRNRAAMPALEYEMTVPEEVRASFAGTARFDFGIVPAGYSWVFPKRAHLSVGALSTRRGFAGLRACLDEYARRLNLGDLRAAARHGYVIPLAPLAPPLVRNRTILVGDAAGFADPVTAEGISFAALSGELAARAILESDGEETGVRRSYEEQVREAITPELVTGRRLAKVLYGLPRVRAALFRRAGQEMCDAVTDVMAGSTTYRAAIRSAVA